MKKTILAFGELLWDLLPTGPQLGGALFNFAFRVNQLGDCGRVVSRLGCDTLGQKAFSAAVKLKMDTRFIQFDPQHPTGTVEVKVDDSGTPDFTILPGVAYDFIEPNQGLINFAARADCFCFGTLVQRSQTTRETLYRLLETSPCSLKLLDINLRKNCFTTQTVTESLGRAEILKLNEDEAGYLADLFSLNGKAIPDFCAKAIEKWSLKCCLVTLAERGAFAAAKDGSQVYVPGHRVEVIDGCGSGDAFTAGFIHKYLRHESLVDCCRFANALGALVATQPGGTTPVELGVVQEMMKKAGNRLIDNRLKDFLL